MLKITFSTRLRKNFLRLFKSFELIFILLQKEWQAIRSLADDRSIVIKNKGSSIHIWDRANYLKEGNKQLSNKIVYKEAEFKEKMLTELVKISNKIF